MGGPVGGPGCGSDVGLLPAPPALGLRGRSRALSPPSSELALGVGEGLSRRSTEAVPRRSSSRPSAADSFPQQIVAVRGMPGPRAPGRPGPCLVELTDCLGVGPPKADPEDGDWVK